MATPATFIQRVQGVLQRMIGYSAGLPQGQIVDPILKSQGAIPLRGEAPSDYQRTGTTVRIRGFERHPVVQSCVRAIVEIAAAIPIQVYKKDLSQDRDNITVVPTNFPAQVLLDSPSPFLSSARLRALTLTHYLIYGNALWFLERPPSAPNARAKPPVSIRIIHPEDVMTVYVNSYGYPIWYLWRDILGYTHTSPATDIMHFRDLNAKGLVFGYPRAASALNDIIGDDEASQFVRQTVTNYGAPPAYALVEESITPEEAAQAEAALYAKMVERGGRGRFVFLGGVKDVKSVGHNMRDLEFPDLRRVSREDICSAFGVDPRMVGITSASKDAGLSGTQYTEARVRLIQQTIEPTLRFQEAEMNLWLAPEWGDCFMRYDPDVMRALVEDDDKTSTRVRSEVSAGLKTVEEGREELDYPAEYRPGDLLAIPSMTQLIPTAIATATSDAAPGDEKPGLMSPAQVQEEPQDAGVNDPGGTSTSTNLQQTVGRDPNRPDSQNKVTEDPGKVEKKRYRPTSNVLTRSVMLTPEQRKTLWSQFDTRATKEEAGYRRQALILFAEERANVGRVLLGPRRAAPENDTLQIKHSRRRLRQMYKPGGEVEQRWTDRFHPLIGDTYAKGAALVTDSLHSTRAAKKPETTPTGTPTVQFDFHLSDPKVQQAIRERASRLAQHVSSTTGSAIDDAISVALREGMSVSQTAKLVDQVAFGATAGQRATTIARTETIGALNQGQFDTAEESGVIEGKEWLTQGDDAVRDSHAECEDQGQIAMSEPFSNGLMHPGEDGAPPEEVVNCRCTLLYYDTLDEGASSV